MEIKKNQKEPKRVTTLNANMAMDKIEHPKNNETSGEICRGVGGSSAEGSAHTTIDLKKPADLAMVHRAIVNGWDTPDHIRKQICEQLIPALDYYGAQQPDARDRGTHRVIKVCRLAVRMDARNRIDEGFPKSQFPYMRRRNPEKRARRTSPKPFNATLLQALRDLQARFGGGE